VNLQSPKQQIVQLLAGEINNPSARQEMSAVEVSLVQQHSIPKEEVKRRGKKIKFVDV